MKRLLSILYSSILLFSSVVAQTPQCGSKPSSSTRHYMQPRVDLVDNANSDGVSRLSCSLAGIPHTSSRIDSVKVIVSGRQLLATDIDGVDFGRYFQWEDEGVIPVDVDFPRFNKVAKGDSIKFYTVHGVYSAPVKARIRK